MNIYKYNCRINRYVYYVNYIVVMIKKKDFLYVYYNTSIFAQNGGIKINWESRLRCMGNLVCYEVATSALFKQNNNSQFIQILIILMRK